MTAIKELRIFLEELRQNYEIHVSCIEHSIEYENIEANSKIRALQMADKYNSIIEVIKSIESRLYKLAKKDLKRINTHGTKELDSEFLRKAEKFLDYTIELRRDFEEIVGGGK